jgi:hypothetical protein
MAFKQQQTALRNALDRWNMNGCGPPPPNAWKWATRPAPSPKQWKGPQRSQTPSDGVNWEAARDAAAAGGAAYLLYRLIRLLPSLTPPTLPTLGPNLAIP